MIVLGIETSCDETAAAVVTDDRRILANVVLSQLERRSRNRRPLAPGGGGFLHYVLDHWVHRRHRRRTHGRVTIVRYADDLVTSFKIEADAREMPSALKERLVSFGLSLHEDKTRLIEFGRLPAQARRWRGDQHPRTSRG